MALKVGHQLVPKIRHVIFTRNFIEEAGDPFRASRRGSVERPLRLSIPATLVIANNCSSCSVMPKKQEQILQTCLTKNALPAANVYEEQL